VWQLDDDDEERNTTILKSEDVQRQAKEKHQNDTTELTTTFMDGTIAEQMREALRNVVGIILRSLPNHHHLHRLYRP